MYSKSFLFTVLTIFLMNWQTTARNAAAPDSERARILVAYFSATGTTARVARQLAEATGGDLYAITPVEPYTDDDLDWNDRRSRSSVEMNDPNARPAIREVRDMTGYDVVFIGYPIWWNLAPRIIETFIERHDLTGKTVIPFATSGGSGIANSAAALRKAYPELDWQEGRLLRAADGQTVREWLDGAGYLLP
ncbi:MAG TPA: NAD(P)H-dependent oxidoreductase [Candidatus Tidjanibacter gallistercoris]|nr:NAD(P)H-dependent oxidoreductase [Candidatus Tidjanibacter gallistercoris]